MADFCTPCAKKMWGDDIAPDIDIEAEFKALQPEHYVPCICEGCGLVAILKTAEGTMKVAYMQRGGEAGEWTDLQPDRFDTMLESHYNELQGEKVKSSLVPVVESDIMDESPVDEEAEKLEFDAAFKIAELIPTQLGVKSMIDTGKGTGNSQEYTRENCALFGVPFLADFVDVDTYIDGHRMRMQGHLTFSLETTLDWDIYQLNYFLGIVESKGGMKEWVATDNGPRLQIWAWNVIRE
jgi:hypothetical protein